MGALQGLRHVHRWLGLVVMLVFGPGGCDSLDGKTLCHSSSDCIDDRVCVDGRCQSQVCEQLCLRSCTEFERCGAQTSVRGCGYDCATDVASIWPVLPEFDAGACRQMWEVMDLDQPGGDSCAAQDCWQECGQLCQSARDCALIHEASTCVLGCVMRREGCGAVSTLSCSEIQVDEILCYTGEKSCP